MSRTPNDKPPPKVVYLNTGRPKRMRNGAGSRHIGTRAEGPPARRDLVDPDAIRTAWRDAFGARLRINDERGFWLDGEPIALDDLMRETNRIRKERSQKPVGRKPEWLV